MATTLRSVIEECATKFATEFANDLIAKLGDLPLSELTNLGGASKSVSRPTKVSKGVVEGGRMQRRDPEALKSVIDSIVTALTGAVEGLSSEQLQAELGIGKKEITHPVILALAEGLIRKEGNKRATRYFAGAKGGTKGGTKKVEKRAAKPAARTTKPKAKKAAKPATKKAVTKAAKKPSRKSTKSTSTKPKAAEAAPEPKTETKDAAAE